MASARERDIFWASIPRRGRLMFFGAVFCVFAPGMVLPVRVDGAPASAVAVSLVCSGLIGMFWALAFTRNRWFLVAALGLQALTIFGFARAAPGWLWPHASGFSLPGAVSMASVALGYALFVMFINTEGRRSVRERTELALAQRIHATLVPPIALEAHGYEVFGRSEPSTEVGGDLVAAADCEGGVDIDLGDVTGHGVRAGVVMAMTRASVHTARGRGGTLSAVLAETNEMLADLTDPGMFVTFAAMRLEPDGLIRAALAGHLPVLHWRASTGSVARLENESLPLGVLGGQEFTEQTTGCEPGDLLVVLTDGLIEVQDADGRQLGMDGFEALVGGVAHLPLPEAFDALLGAVRARGPVEDDQTLLLIRRM